MTQAQLMLTQIKNNKIVFSFNQKDHYFKRAALRKGWVENTSQASFVFTVKWDYSDSYKHDIYS